MNYRKIDVDKIVDYVLKQPFGCPDDPAICNDTIDCDICLHEVVKKDITQLLYK